MDYRKLITELETKKEIKEKEISKIENIKNKTKKDRSTLYSLKLDLLRINTEINKLKKAEVLAKALAEAEAKKKERAKEREKERAKELAEAAERAKERAEQAAKERAKERAKVLAKAAEEADAAAKERAKAAEGRQLAETQIFRGLPPKIIVEVKKEEEVKIEDKKSKQIELYKTNFKPDSNLITKTNLNVKSEEIYRITVDLLQLDQVNKHSLYFFCNSLYLYGLKNYFDYYYKLDESQKVSSSITSVNWILRSNSMNCLHKVFTYKYSISSDTERKYSKFLKVVPYNSNAFSKNDLSLFDIVNGYIFNLILDESNSELNSTNKKAQYKKHVSKFDCSLLSYFKEVSKNKYKWDYDELYYVEGSNVKSPYKPDAENKLPIIYEVPDDPSILYKRCILVITSAIRHYDLFKIIVDYKKNMDYTIEIVQAILESKFFKFFEFMLFMGIKYGFHHHDLHQGNIIYDLDNSELVLIDYGRASFKFYCYNENTTLNSFLVNEIEKLNLLKTTYYADNFNDINSYKKLINKIKVLNQPMSDYILTIDIKDTKSTSSGQMIYPMIVFDLCTLILSIYNLLFEFLKKKNRTNIIQLLINIKDLNINRVYYENTIFDLYKSIYSTIYSTIINSDLKTIWSTIKIVLDGLLLIALIRFYYKSINPGFKRNPFGVGNNVFFIGVNDKNKVILKLLNFYSIKITELVLYNHFLINILDGNPNYIIPGMSGGAKNDGEISEISEISEKNLEDMYFNTYYHKYFFNEIK